MGRKRVYEIVECGKCGKPSVVRDIPTRNNLAKNPTYRVYSYWVHTDNKEKPKKHYLGPANFPYISSVTPRRGLPYADVFIITTIIEQFGIYRKKLKKFRDILFHFPINDESGKSMELINKFKEEDKYFHETVTKLLTNYSSNLDDINNSKHSDKKKYELRLEEMLYFLDFFILIAAELYKRNSILNYITKFSSGESMLGWLKLTKLKIERGNHGAASKSGIVTHDGTSRKFTPKHIRDKEMPELKSLKSLLKRDIPDKELLKHVERMINVLEKDPFSQMLEYIYNYPTKSGYSIKSAIADRRRRLKPDLSEASF